jgi:hypothetical protein
MAPSTRRIFTIGNPTLTLKVYNTLAKREHIRKLESVVLSRGLNFSAIAGVCNISEVEELGPVADLSMYGRGPTFRGVFPYSIELRTGTNLPPQYGRACPEETVLFGKEAALYLEYELDVKMWRKTFCE